MTSRKRFIIGITGATGAIYGVRLMQELLHQDYEVYLTITHAGETVLKDELGLELAGKSSAEKQAELLRYLASESQLAEYGIRALQTADSGFQQLKEVESRIAEFTAHLHYLPVDDIGASIASGSFLTEGMAVVPCSMSTLAGIAEGRSMNLLERAADVMLKEGRPLLLSPREMPLSAIHLENMLKLSRLGVYIVPPMPGFYHHPENLDDLINFVVGKILDRLRISHNLYQRWTGRE